MSPRESGVGTSGVEEGSWGARCSGRAPRILGETVSRRSRPTRTCPVPVSRDDRRVVLGSEGVIDRGSGTGTCDSCVGSWTTPSSSDGSPRGGGRPHEPGVTGSCSADVTGGSGRPAEPGSCENLRESPMFTDSGTTPGPFSLSFSPFILSLSDSLLSFSLSLSVSPPFS